MLHIFDFAREMNTLAVAFRLVLAVLCGGLIGIEREYKRRPAGFRTHILICLGAAMTTLTSQYMFLTMHLYTDVARLGAQVLAGIGFIGAGPIIDPKRQRAKGLTAAAGLWTAAIIGLVCGAGYVECAIFATAMVLVAELLLIKIEYRFAGKINDVNLYVEYAHAEVIENILRAIRDKGIKLGGIEINRIAGKDDEHHYCAVITMRANKKQMDEDVIKELNGIEDVLTGEEL